MSSRWTGFFIWALVAASVAFWGIKVFAATRPVPPGAQAPQAVTANGPMERLFGAVVVPTVAADVPPPQSSRFQLMGVIAPPAGSAQGGFAIIALDGQPARTWRVGAGVDGNTTLLSVSKRGAEFGPPGGPASFTLQLPEPSAAETGTLNAAVSQPDPSQMQPAAAPPQFDAPQRGAQPVMQGRGGFQNGGNVVQHAGRGFQQNGIPPQRPATPPDQPQADGAAPQQQ